MEKQTDSDRTMEEPESSKPCLSNSWESFLSMCMGRPFRFKAVKLKLYLQEITDITVQMWQNSERWVMSEIANSWLAVTRVWTGTFPGAHVLSDRIDRTCTVTDFNFYCSPQPHRASAAKVFSSPSEHWTSTFGLEQMYLWNVYRCNFYSVIYFVITVCNSQLCPPYIRKSK